MRAVVALAAAFLSAAALAAPALAGDAVTSRSSRFGTILFDKRGFVLYAFTSDKVGGKSTCYGACAKAWPPYIVKGAPPQGPKLGTTRRRDGKLQVTYAGRPLYYYVGDSQPGLILCQNVEEYGGLWLVIRPSGKLVR
jgi:predicted lipoprotein with Yx(FWY)xxD motif